MDLIEREEFLALLKILFENTREGKGYCVFVSGEAGIGKTSLVKAFSESLHPHYNIYLGTCDALFTPRPLAPVYDILFQMRNNLMQSNVNIGDRSIFFSTVLQELKDQKQTSLVIFEDIHWADEASFDFIKFLARRIGQLRCLFVLTYRDDEIHSRHPLKNVLGQLNTDTFTRLKLLPLSRPAVEKMALEKGYNTEEVYDISGGNPFYVQEILASYSTGIPENIKDSILSVFNRQDRNTRTVWETLSVFPSGFEIKYLGKMESFYADAIERSLELKVLILKDGILLFKHELYRRTIEVSLSPLFRVVLHKKILDLLREEFEATNQIEKIIHHAKNANEYELVVHYAPLAATTAVCVGAHIEASKLYLSAIEYYQGKDKKLLIKLYDSYAYECYLTNQIKEAIIYTSKSLKILQEKNYIEKIGDCMRFLSRLWWYDGNRKQAEYFGWKAIEELESQPSSAAKAMAYSNMSQLKMLADHSEDSIFWGEKAIIMAKELNDEAILSHALNNVGTVLYKNPLSRKKGISQLEQSLDIALKNSFHEHAARAYTNLSSNSIGLREYAFGEQKLDEGIRYCEKRELDSWAQYMLWCKARLKLETGYWPEANALAEGLLSNENQSAVIKIGALVVTATIKMRTGQGDPLPLLMEAKRLAFETMEQQRLMPVFSKLLEYEWISGKKCIENAELDKAIKLIATTDNTWEIDEFYFWLWKARQQKLPLTIGEAYDFSSLKTSLKAATVWQQYGCPFEQALALFEGNETDKKKAITITQQVGATVIYKKMKQEMRGSGIKNIPRGMRKTTKSNPALLTDRELDVLQLLNQSMQNKEIAKSLFISPKTVDHHITSILFKLDADSRGKAVKEAVKLGIIK